MAKYGVGFSLESGYQPVEASSAKEAEEKYLDYWEKRGVSRDSDVDGLHAIQHTESEQVCEVCGGFPCEFAPGNRPSNRKVL